jgi:hypothetical protein
MTTAPTTAGPGPLSPEVAAINAVLRVELTAIETYEQILPRFDGHPFCNDLRTIRYAHETAAGALRNHVRNLGGEPVAESDAAVRLHSPAASTGNPTAILDELRRTEEQGVAAYERLLQREQMPEECRFAIRCELVGRCHEHVDALAGMSRALSQKG